MKLLSSPRGALLGGGVLALALVAGAGSALAAGAPGLTGAAVAQLPAEATDLSQHRCGPGHEGHPRLRAMAGLRQAALEYLGISAEELREQLRSGMSLGEVADATDGRSRQGVIDALVTATTERIDEAVADGRLSEDRAERMKAGIEERITRIVDASRTPRTTS